MNVLYVNGPQYPTNGDAKIPRAPNDSNDGAVVDVSAGSNVSMPDCTTDGRSASSSIHYSDIRGLCSNFSCVEYHSASFSPGLLLLSETKLSGNASTDVFHISNYNLYFHFCLNGDVCTYCHINTPASKAHES